MYVNLLIWYLKLWTNINRGKTMSMLGVECQVVVQIRKGNHEIAQIPYAPMFTSCKAYLPPFAGIFWLVNLSRSSSWYVCMVICVLLLPTWSLNHLGPTLHCPFRLAHYCSGSTCIWAWLPPLAQLENFTCSPIDSYDPPQAQ